MSSCAGESISAVLHRVLKHELPRSTLSYVTGVVTSLSAEELADFDEVRNLLEPVLLDARKSGRQQVHDRKGDPVVEALCQEVFRQLSTGACTASTRDAVTSALQVLEVKVPVDQNVLVHLSTVLADMSETELADTALLMTLLKPLLLDGFHECAEWSSSDDEAHVRTVACALSELLLQPQSARVASKHARFPITG
mmetsp:Transcript_53234/g.142427  ORF Transcript_53234/g.142427 Transcript_53234/m.142427 type:complete len:196 (-) Transcript_53234:136-723(-)|eukprot:CAMPEP_0194546968 /NCGR_PEP_ID=MMETSP0253-20130528/91439_1 /TAXON_ID=2966 /ORGANISM="Noctiluca scintillans" /LENGTH=195 /DNA_ID=CAMNT_0039394133 /DNA_START=43 /DNA_END=630 /DNA_ORIENTATION=+